MRCAHRKLIVNINGQGNYYVHCLDCGLDGEPHETVAETFLHRRKDLEAAAVRDRRHGE